MTPFTLNYRTTRRAFIVSSCGMIASACVGRRTRRLSEAEASLAALESRIGGRIGLYATDTRSEAHIWRRPDERFAMCSTFKWLLAAAILSKVASGELDLDQRVPFGPADLLAYAPATRAHLVDGALSVEALCQAAFEMSDNTAANLLIDILGGPSALTLFLRHYGDDVTRLDRTEPDLNSNLADDPRDTTTPRAMISIMRALLLTNALPPQSRERIVDWMKHSRAGIDRLRARLPPAWAAADKIGTGRNGAANDVAIFFPPTSAPILIAAFLSDSNSPLDVLDAAHAAIGGIVASAFTQ